MSKNANHETPTPAKSTDRRDLEGAFKDFAQSLEAIAPVGQEWLEAVYQQLRPLAEKAIPHLEALAPIDWTAIKRRLDELPDKSNEAMGLALSKGWFLGWLGELHSLMEIIEKLVVTQPNDIDLVMAEYYRGNFQPFADELVRKHPDRARAISAAVNAHLLASCDGYILCIPVFIAQADGILTEITKVRSALMKDHNRKDLQAAVALRNKLMMDQESLDLLHPILMLGDSDFMKSAAERQIAAQQSGRSFTALNRHQVMHGESSDYGTEINSLKAFSLLVFVGSHLPEILGNQSSS